MKITCQTFYILTEIQYLLNPLPCVLLFSSFSLFSKSSVPYSRQAGFLVFLTGWEEKVCFVNSRWYIRRNLEPGKLTSYWESSDSCGTVWRNTDDKCGFYGTFEKFTKLIMPDHCRRSKRANARIFLTLNGNFRRSKTDGILNWTQYVELQKRYWPRITSLYEISANFSENVQPKLFLLEYVE